MKTKNFLCGTSIILFLILISLSGFGQMPALDKIKGSWVGTLKIKTTELTLVLNISSDKNDSLTVTFDSPDQGAKGLPTSKVIFNNDSIVVESGSLGIVYKGRFNPDFTILTGLWNQSGLSLPLVLKHSDKKFEQVRPQEPKPPFPYIVKEVEIPNKEADVVLAGTLTLPKAAGRCPSVILITGSGPQDRDEEIFGHKPFLVLADYLTRRGIAVLRYDDRGIAKSTGNFTNSTTLDFAKDVSAAVDFLKTQPYIDTGKIGLIGHSEGGMIAPMVATGRDDIDFIVLMAGPGVNGDKILMEQTEAISRANGVSEWEIAAATKVNAALYNILKKTPDDEKAAEKIRKLLTDYNQKMVSKNRSSKVPEEQINYQVKTLISPWFRYFINFDPLDYLSKVKCPLLAINGQLDMQVEAKENLEAIEKAMIFSGNSKYTVTAIPGLNHLFQTATTGSPNEYSKIEETISPIALELISTWILKITK
jgi:pimeloyl-ACP methyl ester carboxylesterase